MLNFARFTARRKKSGGADSCEPAVGSQLQIIVGNPKTQQELLMYGPKKTVICGQHELTEIQIDTLLRVLVASGIQPTVELMRTVAQLSPAAQLRCFPRSAGFAQWAFEQGLDAYFEQQSNLLREKLLGAA